MTQQYLFQDYVEAWRARREQERDHDAPPRRWYRFTLWKMVVAFVLLGAAFGYLRNTHWGYLAGERISDVGRRFGLVKRPDNSMVRVSAVRPFGHLDYEWRISVLAGIDYEIDVIYFGEERSSIRKFPIPHESLISITAEEELEREGIRFRVLDASGVLPRTTYSRWCWAPRGTATPFAKKQFSGVLWGEGEQVFTSGERILLYQAEITHEKGAWGTKYRPGVVIAVWIKPVLP